MPVEHEFGGPWTEDKLDRIERYLNAYLNVMLNQNFYLYYVDAFAGTGDRTESSTVLKETETIDEDANSGPLDRTRFLGSARRALSIKKDRLFNQYIFVESNAERFEQLLMLREDYPHRAAAMRFEHRDANEVLKSFCKELDQDPMSRAVVFLDPYGLSVDWETIRRLARTGKVDLWYLFPVMGINRVLPSDGKVPPKWCDRLDQFFGQSDWRDALMRPRRQPDLFGDPEEVEKRPGIDSIRRYLLERLKEDFVCVAENPLLLKNSTQSPLFLLCFAAANSAGAKRALPIAQHILGMP